MVLLNIENRIATLTLNRPEKRNALNDEMANILHQHLIELATNDDCKVLILKGNGEAFCAGADLGYLQQLQKNSFEENLADSMSLMKMFKALYEFPKVSIAQVQGAAFAGGCGLANLCDFCFATPESKFAYTEVKIGFIPAIVSVFLSPKIGENAAKRMLLTGEVFNAEQAKEMGLVTDVYEQELIGKLVEDFASRVSASTSAQSIQLTKALMNSIKALPLEKQLEMAARANAEARSTEDCQLGIKSFLNKEKLSW
ncbi:MAG: enoyl-CoA hydratase-related protein [Bacteroidia bacterium]